MSQYGNSNKAITFTWNPRDGQEGTIPAVCCLAFKDLLSVYLSSQYSVRLEHCAEPRLTARLLLQIAVNTLDGNSRALLRLPVSGPVVVWLAPASPVVGPDDVLTATVRPALPATSLCRRTASQRARRKRRTCIARGWPCKVTGCASGADTECSECGSGTGAGGGRAFARCGGHASWQDVASGQDTEVTAVKGRRTGRPAVTRPRLAIPRRRRRGGSLAAGLDRRLHRQQDSRTPLTVELHWPHVCRTPLAARL
jgi:hypothetical protein